MRVTELYLPSLTILSALSLIVILGCDASDGPIRNGAKLRAKNCERAGVTVQALKACKETEEGYKRVMEPIWAQEEREEIAVFNAALRALPARSIPKDRYEPISLEVLNSKYKCCFLEFTDATESPKHALFGKRFVVQGMIVYFPTDLKEQQEDHIWLQMQDAVDEKNTWHLDADVESLKRQERTFIKSQCKVPFTFDGCPGQFFGVIERVQHGELEVLGLQIEYMTLSPREPKN